MTEASTFANVRAGDSTDRSLLCHWTQLLMSIFTIWKEFHMLEEYLDLLEVKIIIVKYSYLVLF